MGGHAARRGTAVFEEAALLGRLLARNGRVVATGGGPGTMEAANLGAFLSEAPEQDFRRALADLAAVPSFRPSVSAWARAAAGRRRTPPGGHAVAGDSHVVLRP